MRILRRVNTAILRATRLFVVVKWWRVIWLWVILLLRNLLHLWLRVRHERWSIYLGLSHFFLILLNHIDIHTNRVLFWSIFIRAILHARGWTLLKMYLLRPFRNLGQYIRILCSHTCPTPSATDPLLSWCWSHFVFRHLIIISLKPVVRDFLLNLRLLRLIKCATKCRILWVLLLIWQ